MILQALYDYYQRKCSAADPAKRLPAYGLEEREIPFILEITTDGELVQLRDSAGRPWLAHYRLQRLPGLGWRIEGCVLRPDSGLST